MISHLYNTAHCDSVLSVAQKSINDSFFQSKCLTGTELVFLISKCLHGHAPSLLNECVTRHLHTNGVNTQASINGCTALRNLIWTLLKEAKLCNCVPTGLKMQQNECCKSVNHAKRETTLFSYIDTLVFCVLLYIHDEGRALLDKYSSKSFLFLGPC